MDHAASIDSRRGPGKQKETLLIGGNHLDILDHEFAADC